MKKEYIFILLILVMLYLLYLIIWLKYKEFKINDHNNQLTINNENEKKEVIDKKKKLVYLSTNAYTDYMLKYTRWLRNKWEEVIILNKEKEIFNKIDINQESILEDKYFETNYDKWLYFLLNKEKSIN